MLTPIPRQLLNSTAYVYECDSTASYGGSFVSDAKVIGHVHYHRSKRVSRTDATMTSGTAGKVYIDAVNSDGAYEVPVGAKIVIDGEDHIVTGNEPLYGLNGEIHHWELEVQ